MDRNAIFLFALLCSCSTLSAQMRSKVEAKQLASAFLSSERVEHKFIKPSTVDIIDGAYQPFFMFSDKTSNKFVIISGDVRMKPVLAEGIERTESNEIPDGLSYLLEEYSRQYQYLQDDATVTYEYAMPTPPDVPSLLTSKWGQDSPYNDYCPSSCPSGCVATAMAQVMNYHEYPETGSGSFEYTSRTRRYKVSYDFSKAHFEWSKMNDTYSSSSSFGSNENREAVANLMKGCGVSVSMDYDRNGSGAYSSDIPYALIHYFQYNENVNDYDRSFFNVDEWYRSIYSELMASRPVIYCGVDSRNGGHAFVIDGVRSSDGKFHVNWGWNGNYDGFFELDALDPSTYRFSVSQDMIVHISPDSCGMHEDIFYAEQFICENEVKWESDCSAKIKELVCVANTTSYTQANTSFSGIVGIGVFDSYFNLRKAYVEKPIKDVKAYDYNDYSFIFRLSRDDLNSDSIYYLAPYIKDMETGIITRIRTTGGRSDYIMLNCNEGEEDDPDDSDDVLNAIWAESFESKRIPSEWSQDVLQGDAQWTIYQVVFTSAESKYPEASRGIGYASLTYKSDNIFSMKRCVTKLITNYFVPDSTKLYSLHFAYRKYNESIDDATILTLFIDKGQGWELMKEVPVSNMTFWDKQSIIFRSVKPYRIAFEGSIESGAILFLDDVYVSEYDGDTNVRTEIAENEREIQYTPIGMQTSRPVHVVISNNGVKRFVK